MRGSGALLPWFSPSVFTMADTATRSAGMMSRLEHCSLFTKLVTTRRHRRAVDAASPRNGRLPALLQADVGKITRAAIKTHF